MRIVRSTQPKLTATPVDLAALNNVTAAVARTAAAHDADASFPTEGIAAVHAAGLLTSTVGAAHGGPGWGVGATARVLAALGEGDPSVALISAMTIFQHTAQAARPHWPPPLYAEILRQSTQHPTLLNAARVEPELGSPARGGLPATTARRTGTGWAISGRKRFVTGAECLSYFLVWACTNEPVPKVATFVVPGHLPGIEIVRNWDPLGLRASGSHDVIFTDVEIPAENVLDAVDRGGKSEQDNFAHATLGTPLAAIYLGVGRAAQAFFHRFAHERVPANLGAPVATTARFRNAAGEIEVLLTGAEHLLFGTADRIERGEQPPAAHLLAARVLAVRQITSAVHLAVRLLGNPGLSRHNPLERHFRDVQSAGVHAPQEDVVLSQIGSAVLEAAKPASAGHLEEP